jgi:hypothetical protein
MNSFFGALIGFLGWSFMGFLFSLFLLVKYDASRFPMDEISKADRNYNRRLMVKCAVGGGLIIGAFWFMVIHHNPLISN